MTDIDKNVLKNGKKGLKQNILNALKEFVDEYADETYALINELIKLRAENERLKAELSAKGGNNEKHKLP